MNPKLSKWSRRDFLKATGSAGLGAVMAPVSQIANATEAQKTIPVRPFGKTGAKVSILSMGGMFDIASNQIMMKQAVRWGVTYWDTADCYQRGSETGIGKYFNKYPDIASICSQMPNMTILKANVAAALNKTDLSVRDTEFLHRYACETHSDYCAGCTKICESTVEMDVPIGDVMRYLMYYRSYGELDYAAVQFKTIPENIRLQMINLDYSLAEQRCPQNMAIGKLMKEAVDTFHI